MQGGRLWAREKASPGGKLSAQLTDEECGREADS